MAWLRVCLIGLIAALALLLGACGNREPEARAVSSRCCRAAARGRRRRTGRPAVPEQGRAAGAGRLRASLRHHVGLPGRAAQVAQPLREVLATETLRSVGDIVARHDALTLARKTLQANVAAVREARARADKARSSLELPPDLAPAYDGVYDESLTAPANELLAAADTLDAVARDALAIADFVAANAAGIELAGAGARGHAFAATGAEPAPARPERAIGRSGAGSGTDPSGGGSEPDGSGGDALGRGGVDACDGCGVGACGRVRGGARGGSALALPGPTRPDRRRALRHRLCTMRFRGASRNRDRP